MKVRKYIPPMSIILFLALTLAGIYGVRKMILERHMLAAMEIGDAETMRKLASAWPSPVNAKDGLGQTALHWAAENNDVAAARALLDAGARIDARGKAPDPALSENDYIVQTFAVTTPLHRAILLKRWEVARLLVERGADVNLPAGEGDGFEVYAPLELAVSDADTAFVEFLILSGARVKDCGNQFHWPLKLALDLDGPAMMKLLLDHGADVEWAGVDGYTTLHHAVFDNELAAARFLLEHGAKVNSKDMSGGTPLHLAACYGYLECAEALLARGADVTAKDNHGKTPLAIAEQPSDSLFSTPLEVRRRVADLLRAHSAKE